MKRKNSSASSKADLKDTTRKMSHLGRQRSPKVEDDRVRKRKTQVNILDHLARGGRSWIRRDHPGSTVLHVSFTLTEDLDQKIHAMAVKRNVSRSAIVRQALLHYFLKVGDEVA